jgi:hypothetical protein
MAKGGGSLQEDEKGEEQGQEAAAALGSAEDSHAGENA